MRIVQWVEQTEQKVLLTKLSLFNGAIMKKITLSMEYFDKYSLDKVQPTRVLSFENTRVALGCH